MWSDQDAVVAEFLLLLRSSILQRSEQVFTSAQSFAHFLRHMNKRPHAAQVFCGRSDFKRIFGIESAFRMSEGRELRTSVPHGI
jgi:hypothetical protein